MLERGGGEGEGGEPSAVASTEFQYSSCFCAAWCKRVLGGEGRELVLSMAASAVVDDMVVVRDGCAFGRTRFGGVGRQGGVFLAPAHDKREVVIAGE